MNSEADKKMSLSCSHVDKFIRDNLPPLNQWPEFRFDLPELQYPERMNAAKELLDKAVDEGFGDKIAILSRHDSLSYADLQMAANQVAQVLVADLNLKSGNRVLLRAPNNPMLAITWFAVLKAGGVVVTTMPMLRQKELAIIIEKAEITHAFTDIRLVEELAAARDQTGPLKHMLTFGKGGELEELMATKSTHFETNNTWRDDPALLAFTSGTTGIPKATVHFHRAIMAMADSFSRHILKPGKQDIFAGTPPLAFTFGLGGALIFPCHARATTVLDETAGPEEMLKAIQKFKITNLFTAPTAYRAMLAMIDKYDLSSLKRCVSAGEPLPKPTSDAWYEAIKVRLIDGIGATELIHIFISASGEDVRPGSTGKPVPGYDACILDENYQPLGPGKVGKLAIKGPTGCRYLNDKRQADYVKNGWNITGDAYLMDEDGYYWFQARTDDMIVSGGYNIAGLEVETALLADDRVLECAVVGEPDENRGHVVKAYVVLKEGIAADQDTAKALQNFVKETIAPYKYPRAIEFIDQLPKTGTGKIQRFKLRQMAKEEGQ